MKKYFLLFLFIQLLHFEQVFSQNADAYYHIANEQRLKGNYEKAINYYNEAIRMNPRMYDAFAERGYCKSRFSQHKEALSDYQMAVQLGSKDPVLYLNRGWAYYNLGMKEKACLEWQMTQQLGYEKVSQELEKYCGERVLQTSGN